MDLVEQAKADDTPPPPKRLSPNTWNAYVEAVEVYVSKDWPMSAAVKHVLKLDGLDEGVWFEKLRCACYNRRRTKEDEQS